MSDQYNPNRPSGYTAPTQPPYAARTDVPPTPPEPASTGFGTGMLVALVFVVVAILAVAVFGYNRSNVPPASNSPAVTIDNNATPATPAPPAVDPVTPPPADPVAPAPADPVAPAPADPVTPAPADPAVTTPDTGANGSGTTAPAAPANP